MNSLNAFLDEQVARHGSRLALRHRPRYRTLCWSYADLGDQVRALGAVLAAHGVVPGDRVLLYGENSPHWAAAFFAILARGGVVVPVNPGSPAEQIGRLIASAEPRLAMISRRALWPVSSLPILTIPTGETVAPADAVRTDAAEALAEIIYTSGTTGDPKGVMLTQRNLLSDLEAALQAVPLEPGHHLVSLVPLFHAYGQMSSLLWPLAAGAAVSYLPAPTSRALLETLAETPATHLVAVPAVLKTLMDRIEERLGRVPGGLRRFAARRIRRRLFGSLQTILCGGAALDPVLEEKWWTLGFEVLQGYGLTETSPLLTANTRSSHRLGSVGKPVAGAEIRIAPDGEVLVRGPMVTPGYYRDTGRTEATFVDGWFRTDDAGRFDQDGFLYVFGRKRYMILGPSGENVFPEDIEAELNRLPGVIDSAVVGLEKQGRTLVHAVLLCDPAVADARVAEANARLAPHQRILSWSVWPEPDFPRSVTRKVKKEEVIRRIAAEEPAGPLKMAATLTPLKRLLAQVSRLPADTIDDSARLGADLGIDSLLRIELVSRIEEHWGIALEEVQLTPETTVGDLEALLEKPGRSLRTPGRHRRWPMAPWAMRLRPWAQKLLLESWILPFCDLRVEGLEHLAGIEGPVIFMANHRSFLDSAITAFALPRHLRRRLGIAAATEVLYREYRWAVLWGELTLNAFPFPTGVAENIRPGLDSIGRLLDQDWSVLIFPEGRMNREGLGVQPLKGGTGVIAVEMQVPVVPLVIQGTEKIMPPGKLRPRRRSRVTVRFGEPLRFSAGAGYGAATAHIETRLRELLAEGEGTG